ncbi:XRE family transcriptional regulator [Bifidobacterium crudilactis]|jgi:plasmid maintenance system antidote protein VapI|uniref:XRE family transcriptional regulator n=1 Tax=Bifidobacterium crudilactis TaxID=327277 RepID=UPI002F351876
MNKQSAVKDNFAFKNWLLKQGMSYRTLATCMSQSPSIISKKINGHMQWQSDDLVWLAQNFGLSSDFVLGLIPMSESGLLGVS